MAGQASAVASSDAHQYHHDAEEETRVLVLNGKDIEPVTGRWTITELASACQRKRPFLLDQ
jgi:hypothetical protein